MGGRVQHAAMAGSLPVVEQLLAAGAEAAIDATDAAVPFPFPLPRSTPYPSPLLLPSLPCSTPAVPRAERRIGPSGGAA